LEAVSHKTPIDVFAPSAPGSLMRAYRIDEAGLFRLARRSCELYSVQIVSAGAWARCRVLNGLGRVLWYQPSSFTGSFWLGAGAEDGLLVEIGSQDRAPCLSINWRESDTEMV
jgi:hypothetical protein